MLRFIVAAEACVLLMLPILLLAFYLFGTWIVARYPAPYLARGQVNLGDEQNDAIFRQLCTIRACWCYRLPTPRTKIALMCSAVSMVISLGTLYDIDAPVAEHIDIALSWALGCGLASWGWLRWQYPAIPGSWRILAEHYLARYEPVDYRQFRYLQTLSKDDVELVYFKPWLELEVDARQLEVPAEAKPDVRQALHSEQPWCQPVKFAERKMTMNRLQIDFAHKKRC